MKKYTLITLLALFFGWTTVTNAETNALAEAKENAKTMVATNINQVLIEILTGAKAASGEVYSASKITIGQTYDFVKKETPQVIAEILRWKLVECCVRTGVWGSFTFILLGFSMKLSSWRKKATPSNSHSDSREMASAFKWILRCVALLLLILNLGYNGMTVSKIVSAPRVYIIEYVIDTIQGQSPRR